MWHLVWREILHRKLNFFSLLLAVVLAVTCTVGVLLLVRMQEVQVQSRVAALDDDIRKITKNMGFNVLILPADQNLAEFHASDFAAKTMPQEFVHRIADSRDVFTVQHLRPALVRKLKWPEQNRQIVLMGVSGIVPFSHQDPKKPLAMPVPEGKLVIGSVLADELKLKEGDTAKLLGTEFEIDKIHPARGSTDDITIWVDLAIAQQMLDMDGRINMIEALECNCGSIDRLGDIRREIAGVLGGDVQVIELANKAIARAEARNEVKASGEQTIAEWRRFATIVLPVVIATTGLWVALTSLVNVRQRRSEIGLWRAIGFRSRQILLLFLSKALLVGVAGALMGTLLGVAAATAFVEAADQAQDATRFSHLIRFVNTQPSALLTHFLIVLVATPLLAVLASWLPAMSAATQDPADVLREE